MNQAVEQILQEVKHHYKHIDTILLFGSALNDNWTEQSDVDLFLIDDELADTREILQIDGVEVELQKENWINLHKDIEAERGRLLNRNLSTMIATAQVVRTDSEDKVRQLKQLATDVLKSATQYTEEDVKMWRSSIDDYLAKAQKDLRRQDSVAFYLDTHYVIQNALELSLAIHDVYLPQPKDLTGLLRKTDPELLKILEEFIVAKTLEQKMQTLIQLSNWQKASNVI